MGGAASKKLNCASIKNDYELVIRVSKQLESVLELQFGATGRGLHEKVTSARRIPPPLEKQIRFLATIRNQVIHNQDVDHIPDRQAFIHAYESAVAELERLSEPAKAEGTGCIIS